MGHVRLVAEDLETQTLIHRAEAGDHAAIDEVRSLDPEAYRRLGSLAYQLRQRLVGDLAGDNAPANRAIDEAARALRADLAGSHPSPLEALLAEHAMLCWLHLQRLERQLAGGGGLSHKAVESLERRVSQAQRRFLAACKTLEQVRALMRPAINVQRMAVIGRQQLMLQSGAALTD